MLSAMARRSDTRHALSLLGGVLRSLRGGGGGLTCRALCVCGSFLPGHDVDEEVEHVGLREGRGNVTALQGTALVLLCMNPRAHGQFGDKDIASLGEEDGCFSRDHLDFGVRLHDLLDSCQGQLMELVVVGIILEVVDSLLPISRQNFLVVALKTLMNVGPCSRVKV